MATPHVLQIGMRPPPPTAGILLASPTRPSFIFLGPVGTFGTHEPTTVGAGLGAAAGVGPGAWPGAWPGARPPTPPL